MNTNHDNERNLNRPPILERERTVGANQSAREALRSANKLGGQTLRSAAAAAAAANQQSDAFAILGNYCSNSLGLGGHFVGFHP